MPRRPRKTRRKRPSIWPTNKKVNSIIVWLDSLLSSQGFSSSRRATSGNAGLWSAMSGLSASSLRASFFWSLVTRRSEEHTSELQSRLHLVCRLLLEKKKKLVFNFIDSIRTFSCTQQIHISTHAH